MSLKPKMTFEDIYAILYDVDTHVCIVRLLINILIEKLILSRAICNLATKQAINDKYRKVTLLKRYFSTPKETKLPRFMPTVIEHQIDQRR